MKLIGRSSVSSDAQWDVYNKIAGRILPLVLIGYTIASIDRANVSFAKLQMSTDLGLSEAMYGFGAGVFFIGYCLFEIPSNMILHKVGARIWLTRIMVVWGLISAATLFVQTPEQFYAIRFLLGIAEAGFYPGALLYLTYWFPSYLRSQAVGIMILGTSFSAIIGSPLTGAIMHYMNGFGGMAGWQWAFLIEGLPATFLGIIFFITMRDGPKQVHWLNDGEKAMVTQDLETERAAQSHAGVGHRFGDAFRNPNIWCVLLANFCNLSTLYGITFWMPSIIQRATGAPVFETGLIAGAISIIPMAVLIINARHSDKTRERKWHATAGFAVSGIGLCLAGAFSENPWIVIVGLVLGHSGVTMVSGTIFALPATFVMGAAAAAGFALITTLGNTAGYFTPFYFGVLRDLTGNFSAGFFGMAAMTVLGAMFIQLTPALRKKKVVEAQPAPVQAE